jgi:hypothetical protein
MAKIIPPNDPRRLAEDLIQYPRETLSHELKDWLDPNKDDDKANLVRAVLAMSNSEFGGVIAIGIDKNGNHKAPPPGLDVQTAYEQEAIQLIVSNYASRSFEVRVYFVKHNTIDHPVIVVPPVGAKPVVCRRAIGQGQRPALREGTIFVRSLKESGVPSSAPASWKEIEALFEICFRNREANYADFFSRILHSANPSEIRSLLAKAKDVAVHAMEGFDGVSDFTEYALRRFSTAVAERQVDTTNVGFLDVTLLIDGVSEHRWFNDQNFLSTLLVANPGISASYLWRVYQGSESSHAPYPIAETFEQFLVTSPLRAVLSAWGMIDFMIFDPKGGFFVRKAFYDDLLRDAQSGQTLEPIVQLLLVSEAFIVGSRYAKALSYGPDTTLRFSIRWSGLRARQLFSRTDYVFDYYPARECYDEEVQLELALSIAPSRQEIIQKATEAIQHLARAFSYNFTQATVQRAVNAQLDRVPG